MYTKKDLIASLETEVRIIKHLASQLGEDHYEFKPTDSQRTVLELLQYLSFVAGTQTRAIIEGDVEVFKNNAFAAKSLTADEFEAKMDSEMNYMRDRINDLSNEDIDEEVELFGITASRGALLVEFPLKHLVAYRMQLFLYAKHAGLADLDTWDAWRGMSNPNKSER